MLLGGAGRSPAPFLTFPKNPFDSYDKFMSTPANQLPGQAPAGDSGQAPTPTPAAPPAAPAPAQAAGDPAPPATPTPAPAAPQAGTQVTDVEQLQKLLNAANAEAAKHRTKLKEIDDAGKSEAQKLKEANEALTAQTRLLQVQLTAQKLGIVDPEAAAALLPANTPSDQIETQLALMLAARPWLKGTAAPVNTPGVNPPKTPGSGLTIEQIRLMSADEINSRWAEVEAVMKTAGKTGITP